MSLEQNKTFMQMFLNDVYNNGNLAVVDEVITPHLLRGAFKRGVQLPRSTFSDFHLSIDELIAEDEKVVARCTMHGIFERKLLRLVLINRSIEVEIIGIFRLSDNQIKGLWYLRNELGFFRQLGPIGIIFLFLKFGKRSNAT